MPIRVDATTFVGGREQILTDHDNRAADVLSSAKGNAPAVGCASQFWVKSNERVVFDSEGVRRAADACLSAYKHDAQASVSENSLARASCLYADSCRSPKCLCDFDRLG